MTVKRDGIQWKVDIRPNGATGKRIRKSFTTKAEALRFEAHAKNQSVNEPWNPKKADKRRLDALVKLWFELHGHTLKDGKARLSKLENIVTDLANPLFDHFSEQDYLKYRTKRQAAGVTDNTCNHDLTYLKAVFNTLKKRGEIDRNPLENTSKLKIDQARITYLEWSQINDLRRELMAGKSPDAFVISEICLTIGCRWGEAESLTRQQVTPQAIQLEGTKNGKSRLIPINSDLYDLIVANRPKSGRLFKDSYEGFTNALERAEIELPRGQRTHVLRHSYAVHFMRGRGNILDLKTILGHETIDMTFRYAQFHPEYLAASLELNPLAQMKQNGQLLDIAELQAIKKA